jgi:hypothetical protein
MRKIPRVKRHAVTQPQDPSYRLIPLTKGQNAIVDTSDYDWLNQWNWYAEWNNKDRTFRAGRNGYRTGGLPASHILMHRVILDCKPGEEVDHEDRNPLNNRRKNLRKCTHSQNVCNASLSSGNKSGFKGVSKVSGAERWVAQIQTSAGKKKHVGYFYSPEEAARAYDKAAKEIHGEFAFLNFTSSRE